jgi:alpha 1,2-mannosyltransferase
LHRHKQGALYYRLLCSYMGTGDKETWAFGAALAGGAHPARVGTPAGSAGVRGARHPEQLLSNTMLQHHPASGAPLFAHSNLFKWTLDVPTEFARYRRRWQVATPPGWDAAALAHGSPPLLPLPPAPPALLRAERQAWEALRALRCAPWFPAYLALRRARFGETHPDAATAGEPPPAYRGMLLSEHAGGSYEKQYAWAWSAWRGPFRERVAAR